MDVNMFLSKTVEWKSAWLKKTTSEREGRARRREPTIFRHLPRASFQQQPDPPAAGLDELDGASVSHVPGAVPVNLYDLIAHLQETRGGQGGQPSAFVCPREDKTRRAASTVQIKTSLFSHFQLKNNK